MEIKTALKNSPLLSFERYLLMAQLLVFLRSGFVTVPGEADLSLSPEIRENPDEVQIFALQDLRKFVKPSNIFTRR